MFASLGMKCETGTCIYDDEGTVKLRTESKDDLKDWMKEHQADLIIGLMWICFIVALLFALAAIRRDKQVSLQRTEEWANDLSKDPSQS